MTPEQLAFLAANDDDPFNRWDASQRLYTAALLEMIASYQAADGDESKMVTPTPTLTLTLTPTLTMTITMTLTLTLTRRRSARV